MSGTLTVTMIQDALRSELGWSAVREVPPNFSVAVERGDLAMLRWARQDNPERALDEAVREWEGVCNHLGFAQAPLYFSKKEAADDSAASDYWERGLAMAPSDGPEHAIFLHNRGSQMVDRYRRTGQLPELNAAIPLLQAAVDIPHAGSHHMGLYLRSLGTALMDRYERQGALADLESAVLYAERALKIAMSGSAQRNGILNLLGSLYRQRFERTRNDDDIRRAILFLEESKRTASSQQRPFRLTNLGSALLNRYGHSGAHA